jgi:hypothetical protein
MIEDFARDAGRAIGCVILILAASSCAIGVAIGLGLQ